MKKKLLLPIAVCSSICLMVFSIVLSKNDIKNLSVSTNDSIKLNYAEMNNEILAETKDIIELTELPDSDESSIEKKYVSDIQFNSIINAESISEESLTNNATLLTDKFDNANISTYVVEAAKSVYNIAKGVLDKDGIKSFKVYLYDTDNTDIKEMYFVYITNSDEEKSFAPGVFYDSENKLLYGKDEQGIFALGFDYDIGQHIGYNPRNAWQRSFGFCSTYDKIINATLLMVYDTEQIKFEYNNKDWMIQIWKGNYLYASGAEIGIYNKSKVRPVEFYDTVKDDEFLQMSISLVANEDGHTLFSRDLQYHWWLTGYDLRSTYSASEMTMEGVIIFKDEDMLNAFVGAAEKINGFNFETDGLKLSYRW